MKTIYSIIAAFLLLLTSCSEDLLNIENPNAATVDTYWQTEEDAEAGTVAIYHAQFRGGLYSSLMDFRYFITSDEGYCDKSDTHLKSWTNFTYIDYNSRSNIETWGDLYRMIFRTNQVLAYVPDIEFADEERKNQLLAEARFFRGMAHFDLALIWETAPIVTEPSSVADRPSSSTLEEMLTFVQDEFREAARYLPVKWDDANIARPTKGAALAYLAKAQMQQQLWDSAKVTLDHFFIGELQGRYELMENYRDNFIQATENNEESLFEIQFTDVYTGGMGNITNPNMGCHRAMNFGPQGIGNSMVQARPWIQDEYRNETTAAGDPDPRMGANLFYSGKVIDFPTDYQVYGQDWSWGNSLYIRKYQNDDFRDSEDYQSPNNMRLVRYADILLMYAEVLNQVEGDPANAVIYLDMVRERAGLNKLSESTASGTLANGVPYAYADAATNSVLFQKRLEMERALELCFEPWRWADLKRWGHLESEQEIKELISRDADFVNFRIGISRRMPILRQDTDNNENLDQNTGY